MQFFINNFLLRLFKEKKEVMVCTHIQRDREGYTARFALYFKGSPPYIILSCPVKKILFFNTENKGFFEIVTTSKKTFILKPLF